jgi:hypothetical protein
VNTNKDPISVKGGGWKEKRVSWGVEEVLHPFVKPFLVHAVFDLIGK